eukprot:6937571-Pyramimonas_sp.AAC.1
MAPGVLLGRLLEASSGVLDASQAVSGRSWTSWSGAVEGMTTSSIGKKIPGAGGRPPEVEDVRSPAVAFF